MKCFDTMTKFTNTDLIILKILDKMESHCSILTKNMTKREKYESMLNIAYIKYYIKNCEKIKTDPDHLDYEFDMFVKAQKKERNVWWYQTESRRYRSLCS